MATQKKNPVKKSVKKTIIKKDSKKMEYIKSLVPSNMILLFDYLFNKINKLETKIK